MLTLSFAVPIIYLWKGGINGVVATTCTFLRTGVEITGDPAGYSIQKTIFITQTAEVGLAIKL